MSRATDITIATHIMTHVKGVMFYSTDASCDYMVLNHIRKIWVGDIKMKLFLGSLFQIYANRNSDPELMFLQYQPGDYSLAVAEVIKIQESQ